MKSSKRWTDDTLQLIIVSCAYLVALIVVIYFTRATLRRVVGAFAGGAVVGVFGMVQSSSVIRWIVARTDLLDTALLRGLFYLGLAISVTPIYLVTWSWSGVSAGVDWRLQCIARSLAAAGLPVRGEVPGMDVFARGGANLPTAWRMWA